MEAPSPTDTRSPHRNLPSLITSNRRRCRTPAPSNPALDTKIHEMSLPLAPFIMLDSGAVHPAFPRTLLHFWLLTEDQLDALAAGYHQASFGRWTLQYPCTIAWTWSGDLSLEQKRRKMGKFIGLRGCNTPVEEQQHQWVKTEEQIMEDARRARMSGDGDDEIRRKMGWY
ncbi:hypothetical protein B0H66DRAFT_60055 [Apodospora peruviana]|uniref:Uncharacterized protein n=1 Tax=Apodospora peruviana TaxID=516989 RepID=A0AAE0MGR6_9PEZI|nr:hypothetical protein B0H66DRAFT_60055 [Apodospora peruviana]